MSTPIPFHSGLCRAGRSTRRRWGLSIRVLAWVLTTSLPLVAQPLTGGAFSLIGGIATGSGSSSGGPFSITGWAVSAGAGTSTGGEFGLVCGLPDIYAVPNGDVPLNVELTGNGDVRLWWPTEATGYQLQFSTALGPEAVWRPVEPAPGGNAYTTAPLSQTRFFRLQLP